MTGESYNFLSYAIPLTAVNHKIKTYERSVMIFNYNSLQNLGIMEQVG